MFLQKSSSLQTICKFQEQLSLGDGKIYGCVGVHKQYIRKNISLLDSTSNNVVTPAIKFRKTLPSLWTFVEGKTLGFFCKWHDSGFFLEKLYVMKIFLLFKVYVENDQ